MTTVPCLMHQMLDHKEWNKIYCLNHDIITNQKKVFCSFGYIGLPTTLSFQVISQSLVFLSTYKTDQFNAITNDDLQVLQHQVRTLNHLCDLSMIHSSYLLSLLDQ